MTLHEHMRQIILETLALNAGNRTHTAKALGINRTKLVFWLGVYRKEGAEVTPPKRPYKRKESA